VHELRAEKVTAGYPGGPLILDEVSIKAESSEISVVLGPNGAGKSTLAKAIVGRLSLSSGRIYLDDTDLTGTTTHQLVRKGVAYLPQVMNVFRQMTVLENLEMGGYARKKGLADRITQMFEVFPDLAVDKRKKASELSGGQQRMLALARMLVTDPVVAILDEPTAGLSPMYADMVWERLRQIRDLGVGLLVIEQNADIALQHADSVYLLALGKNVLTAPVAQARESSEISRILVG